MADDTNNAHARQASKNISHGKAAHSSTIELRRSTASAFRSLPAASTLNLGNMPTEDILIDDYPTFRSNLGWLVDQPRETRVLGGLFTTRYSDVAAIFPKVVRSGVPREICTGVLISTTTVLTAAHCICEGVGRYVQFGAVVGPNIKTFGVKNTSLFSGIDCNKYKNLSEKQKIAELRGRDVGLLELREEVPPQLASPRRVADSIIISQWNQRSIRVVGFGLDENNNFGRKIHADVALVSANCTRTEAQVFGCAPDVELVAQSKDFSTDTCNGDSGGPAYIYDASSDHFYLIAITSRGLPGRPCGHGGVYELASSQEFTKFMANRTNILIGRGPR